MLKRLTDAQLDKASHALATAMKRWKTVESSSSEFLVMLLPPAADENESSPIAGQELRFWGFNQKKSADRFRNRKIVDAVIAALQPDGAT